MLKDIWKKKQTKKLFQCQSKLICLDLLRFLVKFGDNTLPRIKTEIVRECRPQIWKLSTVIHQKVSIVLTCYISEKAKSKSFKIRRQ